MLSRLTAVLASSFLWALMLAAPAHATFPGANGKLAYASCGSNDCGVFVVEPDGSNPTQITHNPFRIPTREGSYPAADYPTGWSADGSKISYTRQLVHGTEAHIADADGTGDTVVGLHPSGVFSPDGMRLAYADYLPSGYPQIFVSNADGSGATQRTNGSGAYAPDWSPDGTRIAFNQPFSGAPEIYVMDPDGGNQVQLTHELQQGAWTYGPSWSPDGAKIAFTRTYQGQQYEIYSMNANGSGLVNLTDNYVGPPDYTRIDDEAAAWSPDGAQIAFVRSTNNSGGGHIFIMNANGSGARELVAGTTPVWQPLAAPRRSDYKNAAQFCKAERAFLGEREFRHKYGTGPKGGANAYGKCVSRNH
jgi:Tol biopolymer transport system component